MKFEINLHDPHSAVEALGAAQGAFEHLIKDKAVFPIFYPQIEEWISQLKIISDQIVTQFNEQVK